MPKTYTATEVEEIVRECLGEREMGDILSAFGMGQQTLTGLLEEEIISR